jgi:hypothetical protein
MLDHRAGNSFLRAPRLPALSGALRSGAPTCLEELKARIRDGAIRSDGELHRQLLLLFAGAFLAAPEGTPGWENARDLFHFAHAEMRTAIAIARRRPTGAVDGASTLP